MDYIILLCHSTQKSLLSSILSNHRLSPLILKALITNHLQLKIQPDVTISIISFKPQLITFIFTAIQTYNQSVIIL